MKRILALDYGRGTMAGYYLDPDAGNPSPRKLMSESGEPSGFALLNDGTYRLGHQLYTMGKRHLRDAIKIHLNIKELPNGDDDLQVEYAKAWRDKIVADNPSIFGQDVEEYWIIGCPTGWRSRSIIDHYKDIFVRAGYPHPIIVPESNAAMMANEEEHDLISNAGKDCGILCIDLGAYSADSTFVLPGKVSSYGGYVGASLIEKMILELNLKGEFCEKSVNPVGFREAIQKLYATDPKFCSIMVLFAKKLKETYFAGVNAGADFDEPCSIAIPIVGIGYEGLDKFGTDHFTLLVDDRMIKAVIEERLIEEVLGEKFRTLPQEVQNEVAGKTWRESLKQFIKNTLKICPDFATTATGGSGNVDAAFCILTGGATLMPVVEEVAVEVMPNARIHKDEHPMTTIAKGLAYFGPDKLKAMEFDEEFERVLTHDADGNEVDAVNAHLNVIISRAHDKLGEDMIGMTIVKMTNMIVDSVNDWKCRDIDSGSIVPRARKRFKEWFEGEMRTQYRACESDTKQYIAEELNKLYAPLLERYNMGALLTPDHIDLEYAENFLNWWTGKQEVFDQQIAEEDAIYSQFPNPGAVGSFFGPSRSDFLDGFVDTLNSRNDNWRTKVREEVFKVFNSPEVYGPFKFECLAEIMKVLRKAKKTKLGDLIVEDTFDDEEDDR